MTTRRDLLGGLAATALLPALPARARTTTATMPALIAGTYANEGGAGLYTLAPAGAGWRVAAPAPLTGISFGVTHGAHRYLAKEQAKGRLIVTDRNARVLADVPSGGDDPCHVAIAPDARALAVANYSSGTVSVWPLGRDGRPGTPTVRQQHGTGPHTDRQAGPHAHWVGFTRDARRLHTVDLGADTVFAYDMAGAVPGEPRVAWRAPAGAGPRHLAHHPRLPVAYVVTELGNTLVTLDAHADGTFTTRTTQSLLPAGFAGASFAAHLSLDARGRRLYASNRGHDSIAVFDFAADGTPRLIQHIASGGHWPRFFLLLEDRARCLVANERSGTVAVFRILPDGRLAATGQVLAVPGVVFLDRA